MRGINISGEIKIFKNEYGYSTTVSNKDINGNWDRMYITVQLPKGQELDSGTVILITKGFLTFYKDKSGFGKPKAVIQEFMVIGQEEQPTSVDINELNAYGDDLPF